MRLGGPEQHLLALLPGHGLHPALHHHDHLVHPHGSHRAHLQAACHLQPHHEPKHNKQSQHTKIKRRPIRHHAHRSQRVLSLLQHAH